MRSKRYWIRAALLAGQWASPAVAQPHWITFHIGGFNDAQAVKLTNWINDTCRPDEMGHIAGFSYQEAPGKPLNLQVYCRKGGTGKLGEIKVAVKRNGEESIRRNHRGSFTERFPHIARMVQDTPGIHDVKGTLALRIEVEDAHYLDLPRSLDIISGKYGVTRSDTIGIDVHGHYAADAKLGCCKRVQARAATNVEE